MHNIQRSNDRLVTRTVWSKRQCCQTVAREQPAALEGFRCGPFLLTFLLLFQKFISTVCNGTVVLTTSVSVTTDGQRPIVGTCNFLIWVTHNLEVNSTEVIILLQYYSVRIICLCCIKWYQEPELRTSNDLNKTTQCPAKCGTRSPALLHNDRRRHPLNSTRFRVIKEKELSTYSRYEFWKRGAMFGVSSNEVSMYDNSEIVSYSTLV
jgi:hypothetical protein